MCAYVKVSVSTRERYKEKAGRHIVIFTSPLDSARFLPQDSLHQMGN